MPPSPINIGSGKENMVVSNDDRMEAAISITIDGFQSYMEANKMNGTGNRNVAIKVITGTKAAISISIMNTAVNNAPSVSCLDWLIDCTLFNKIYCNCYDDAVVQKSGINDMSQSGPSTIYRFIKRKPTSLRALEACWLASQLFRKRKTPFLRTLRSLRIQGSTLMLMYLKV